MTGRSALAIQITLFVLIGLMVAPLAAGDGKPSSSPEAYWPHWRGPGTTGGALRGDPPVEWNESKNVKWKTEIPGKGHASPVVWNDRVLFSEPERAAFQQLLDLGLCDSFRLFEQPEKSFTWWDYRMSAFRRNMGLRIDHVLASKTLCEACTTCSIDKGPRGWERPSDHAPVVAEFKV